MRRPALPTALLLPVALLPVLLASSACSARHGPLTAAELDQIAARRGVPASVVELPFALTPEMEAWLDETVNPRQRFEQRLDSLLRALLWPPPRGRGIVYEPGHTGTAAEVFAERRANCLGFTNIFVGMARHLGVPVHFLAVDEVEDFQRDADLVVVSRHITAGFGPRHDMKVLEFTLGPEVDYKSVRPVSDLSAVALFYSNRGAELLRAGDLEQARRMTEIAVAVDPELPIAWVNAGVTRRRDHDLDGAEAAYRRALELNPRAVSAYQNMASLMRVRGRPAEADRFLSVIPKLGSRNPYNYLSLGDLALSRGEMGDARRYYRKALRLYRDHPEPYAALARWALEAGDVRAAERWLERARRIDPDNRRIEELEGRL